MTAPILVTISRRPASLLQGGGPGSKVDGDPRVVVTTERVVSRRIQHVGQRGPLVEEVVRADAETGVERRHRVVQLDVVVNGPAHGRVGAGGLIYVQGDEPVDPTRLPLRAKVPLDPVERRLAAPPGDIAELRTIGAGIIDGLRAGLAGRGIVVVRRRIGRVESYLERTGIHAAQVEVR